LGAVTLLSATLTGQRDVVVISGVAVHHHPLDNPYQSGNTIRQVAVEISARARVGQGTVCSVVFEYFVHINFFVKVRTDVLLFYHSSSSLVGEFS
jgi:hypothetical protein